MRGGCAQSRAHNMCACQPLQPAHRSAHLHTPIRTRPSARMTPAPAPSNACPHTHPKTTPQLARKSRLRTPSTHGLRARSGELACARLLPTGCARTLARHPAHATARAQPLRRMPARTHAAHALCEPPAALNCELLTPALPSSSCRFPASSQIKTKNAPRLDPLNHRGAVGLRRACKSSGDKRMAPRRAAKDVFGHIEPGFSGLGEGARPQRWPSSRNPVLRSMRLSAQTPGAGNEPSTAARVSAPIPHMRHSRVLSRRHSLSPDSSVWDTAFQGLLLATFLSCVAWINPKPCQGFGLSTRKSEGRCFKQVDHGRQSLMHPQICAHHPVCAANTRNLT